MVTGLLEPLQGTVDLGVALPDVGFLFQDDALLPWRTARQNVALGLRIRDVPPPADADARADHWLATLGLAGYGDRFPRPALRRPAEAGGHRPGAGPCARGCC